MKTNLDDACLFTCNKDLLNFIWASWDTRSVLLDVVTKAVSRRHKNGFSRARFNIQGPQRSLCVEGDADQGLCDYK